MDIRKIIKTGFAFFIVHGFNQTTLALIFLVL